jgi:hypothetical protein
VRQSVREAVAWFRTGALPARGEAALGMEGRPATQTHVG